jgi:hypothetical protein
MIKYLIINYLQIKRCNFFVKNRNTKNWLQIYKIIFEN